VLKFINEKRVGTLSATENYLVIIFVRDRLYWSKYFIIHLCPCISPYCLNCHGDAISSAERRGNRIVFHCVMHCQQDDGSCVVLCTYDRDV